MTPGSEEGAPQPAPTTSPALEGTDALLLLADALCDAACEVSNHSEPAPPYPMGDGQQVEMVTLPKRVVAELSKTLNAFWDRRHAHD